MYEQARTFPGTIVWIAPFYNRSGFGVGARATACALHRAGMRIRVVPVDQAEPGIDDCDLALIKSLELTPITPPVTLLVFHIPSRVWLNLKLPEPNMRAIATTVFDCSADGGSPPVEMLDVCREMDQIWLASEGERQSFIAAGFPPEKLQLVYWPHPWLENPVLPPVSPEPPLRDKPFRFLSISLFLPRRRWDTLIEAYLEEFKSTPNVELYLKVNFPSWHPVPAKPRQDLFDLIDSLRRKTGSNVPIVIDEDLGTRTGILRLIDSCHAYVSTDTASTAPISEARVRRRVVIIPEGLGLPGVGVQIPVDPHATIPLTPEMLLYQPNHKGAFMQKLHVKDVREAMRRAFDSSPDERAALADAAKHIGGPSETLPMAMAALNAGWECKKAQEAAKHPAGPVKRITWEGSQLVCHSLALINRELCLRLIDSGYEVSLVPGNERDDIRPGSDPRFEKIVQRTRKPLSGTADVCIRHHWPPNFEPPAEGHWVMIQPWEYGRLPEGWVPPMAGLVDEIWVPSRHVLKACIASGVPADRVQVVPNGVNIDQFNPNVPKYPIGSAGKFRFLFVGGGLWRKGVDILLDAYRKAFSSRDDVVLVIKDLPQQKIYVDQGLGKIIRQMQADPDAPEILHLQAALAPEELPGLYTAADCLVHPYRAEGFALPVLEAMACGIPVITTEGGSTDDFCPPDLVSLIPAGRREFKPKDIRLVSDGGWVLQPDWIALSTLMREVFENHAAAKERAVKASEYVRSRYDWNTIAQKVAARIDALTQKLVRRWSSHGAA